MTRNAGISIENKFTKGLITEVTGVNSPENSVVQTNNIIYDRNGPAYRRQGIDYEVSHVIQNLASTTSNVGVVQSYLWETANNLASANFVVIQYADYLFFYATGGSSLSGGLQTFTVNLNSFLVSPFTVTNIINQTVSFSAGNGKLFVVHPCLNPFYVTYNLAGNSITTTTINVQARDFEGVPDGLPVDGRSSPLLDPHKYNLYNQGWYQDVSCALLASNAYITKNAIAAWTADGIGNTRPDFPSNCDVWWYYRGTITGGTAANTYLNVFDQQQISAIALGNTPAPKGHYVYSAWDTARNAAISTSGLPETSSNSQRPSVTAFYFGRLFLAGVRADKFASSIYFSQIVQRDEQYGFMMQAGDPTSELNFDLLPSDGGVIKIQDMANVIDMRVIGPSLYVFATNGVWAITGSNNSGFKATDYQVTKISKFPAQAKTTIIDIGGLPVWWNNEAIYALVKDTTGFNSSVTNLTFNSIQGIYDAIPSTSKLYAQGVFNELQGLVYWLYRSTAPTTVAQQTQYDSILVMDAVTKALYTFTIDASKCFMSGIVVVPNGLNNRVFKITTTGNLGGVANALTFSEFNNIGFVDWQTELAPGLTYDSSFTTGYRIRGSLVMKFQENYLTVITQNNPLSSCFVQGVWDYANDPQNSGRYTNPQQVYKTNNYYAGYQRSKVKIRGQGYSLQFRFFSDANLPFNIVGWAGFESTNTIP
jgi:hypothetical protein